MSNIQQLRKLAIKAATDGTLEQVSAPFKLYKGGYGFIGIQYYVAVTPNTTNAPFCSVYKTSIDLEGKRIKGTGNYNLIYVGRVVLDNFAYSLFECPMPKEFTDTEGDLQIVFNYADTDGQGTAISLLTANIFNTYVSAGGWNNEGVQLELTSQEAAQINQNTIEIGNLRQEQSESFEDIQEMITKSEERIREEQENFINSVQDVIDEAEELIEKISDKDYFIDANFELENSTTVAKFKTFNPKSGIENLLTKPMLIANEEQDGLMHKSDVVTIKKIVNDIETLKNQSKQYSVTIPENPTQNDLQTLYEIAANLPTGSIAPNGIRLTDFTKNITYQFVETKAEWTLVSVPTIGLATNDNPGLTRGSIKPGDQFVNSDGTLSTNGWDKVVSDISNALTQLSDLLTQLSGKQATITGAASSITSLNLTASRVLTSNASGKVAVATVTATELGYLAGVTSAIQTQLNNLQTSINAKFTLPSGGTATQVLSGTGTLITPSATPTSGGTVPFTNGGAYTQLALKAPLVSPTFTGTPRATTPAASSNDTRIATTAFVQGEKQFKTLWEGSQAISVNVTIPGSLTLQLGRSYIFEILHGGGISEFKINLKMPTLPSNKTFYALASATNAYSFTSKAVTIGTNWNTIISIYQVMYNTGSPVVSTNTEVTTACTLLRIIEVLY